MVFLNLLLAGGLAAVSAPVIIHLLHKSKVVPHDWGAMMFLEELLAEHARRMRMHEILLLIVRALIVGCLSLALMRPVIKWASAGVRSPSMHSSAVILLDNSYSMNAGRPQTAWKEAQETALRYVGTLQKGDDATVLFTSGAGKGAPPAPLFDLDRVREIIRTAQPRFEKTDMPGAISAALQLLETRHNPQRELIVFSDMQAEGWDLQDGARWSYLSSSVRASRLKPNIVLASVAARTPVNAALTEMTMSRAVVDCYSPVVFNFTIANEGPESMQDVAATFSVDGSPKTAKKVNPPLNGREVLSFDHKFDKPGSHYVACKLRSNQDQLDEDDEVLHSVLVIDRLPVLIVDGDRRSSPLASASGFFRIALSPKDQDDPTWRTVIEPTVVEPSELKYTDISKFKVVALVNVAALPGSVVSDLERFVVAGGGLFLSLGDHIQTEAYNRDLYRQGSGLLPAPLERVQSPRKDEGPAVQVSSKGEDFVHLGGIVSGAPALDLFRPEKGQDWSKARIRSYALTASLAGKEDVRTLASFSNGAPALIQKKMGEGRVLLLTTSVDSRWSDLPLHPFYVPLMQSLVLDLASAVIPPRNLRVGQALSHVATGEAARKSHTLIAPRMEPVALTAQNQGPLAVFTFESTAAPGLYTVAPEGAPADDRVYYTVSPDRRESALKRLKDEDYRKIETEIGAHHADNWSSLARLIGLDAGGYEISQYLIMAAVALCFVEIFLTRRNA